MTDNELKDECMENAEIDLRRYSNDELTQIREAMRMYADRKLKLFAIPDVSKRRELLIDFCSKVEETLEMYGHLAPNEAYIDEYLKGN